MTKIRVKIGTAEAEVEADHDHIREAIDLIPEVAAKLPAAVPVDRPDARYAVAQAVPESAEKLSASSIPVVTLEKGDSLSDVIGKFFADPWGRERRKLSDVRAALQSYGLNYPKQSVAVALLRLAKTTKIRRFKAEDGEYVYTSAQVHGAGSTPRSEEPLDEIAATQPN